MWNFLSGVTKPVKRKIKTPDELLETRRDYEKKRVRSFQDAWKKEFQWLLFDADKQEMTCKICIKYETSGTFVNGCSNFKLQTLRKHNDSESHIRHCARDRASSKSAADTEVVSLLNKAATEKLRYLFANAHYVAKLGRPYTDYVQMCKLDRSNKGIDIGVTYTTNKACQMFVKAIADSIRKTQNVHLDGSDFMSIISDGSTDSSSKETECILVRSANQGKVETHFMGVRHVAKADSQTITQAIVTTLDERYKDQWVKKVVAVGCDGASVMLGCQNGVVQKLRQHTGSRLFAVHCSAHRLELAFRDATKVLSTRSKVHQKCEALLLNLYLFYKCSPLNRANLEASFDTLGQKMVVPTRVGGTRWLPHTERAIKHVISGKQAILQHLQQIQNPSDAAHRKDSAAKGKNFLKLLTDQDVVTWLYFLMDVVSCLGKVSKAIQEENATLADVFNELESAKLILTKFVDSAGPYLRKVETKGAVEVSRKEFLHEIIKAIDKRFAGDLQLFKGSSLLSFKNWPETLSSDLEDFGDDDIADLVGTCEAQLQSAGCEPEAIETEWVRFKTAMYNSKKGIVRSLTWPAVWTELSEKYGNLAVLISLLLSLPSSSVDAERGFSRMKIQKSDWRSRLGDANLTDLILISLEGPEVGEFCPDDAIKQWEASGRRVRRPFYSDTEKPKQKRACTVTEEREEEEEVIAEAGVEVLEEALTVCDGEEEDDLEEEEARRDLIALQKKSYSFMLSLIQ